jgi:phosphoglycerate dehydrogenase-like enzyme
MKSAVAFLNLIALLTTGQLHARDVIPASVETRELIQSLGLTESSTAVRDNPVWQKPKRIAIHDFRELRVNGQSIPEIVQHIAGDAEILIYSLDSLDELSGADVILGYCTPAVLAAAFELRWMHSFSVGVDGCTLSEEISEHDFILTNNQRGTGPDIAEHVIALMMALTRNLDFYVQEQQAGRWSRGERQAININGKTMLVLGLGGIGTEVARRAHGLGMRVIATRNSSREGPGFVDYVGLSNEMLKLAAEADVIANTLPLTEETEGLVDAGFFGEAKPGALYLNVGRGKTTDTEALVAALRSGQIGGAGLDVTDPEPLPADHPLMHMENVIITPHISAHTDESTARTMAIGLENLRRYTLGEPLLSEVDFSQGY